MDTIFSTKHTSDLMYRLLVRAVNDYAIYLIDTDGYVLNWNVGAERSKGFDESEIVGQHFERFFTEKDRREGLPQRSLEQARDLGHFSTKGWRIRKDGSVFWARVTIDAVEDESDQLIGFAIVTRDLTDGLKASEQLEFQAQRDPLTGVLNRYGLTQALHDRSSSCIGEFAIHCIDLDRFKPINDMFGHSSGDELLRLVAKRLEELATPTGLVARIGGDEFVVIQFDLSASPEMAALANRIVEAMSQPFQIGEQLLLVGATVGATLAPAGNVHLDTLLNQADLALYCGKAEGRSCARFYQPEMGVQATERRRLEAELRRAVAEQRFVLEYQPIVDSLLGETHGFEALIRWKSASGEMVPPSQFIPLAEELGLMPALGEWILRAACREATGWAEPWTISVNLSPIQLKQDDLYDAIVRILAETGLEATRLELEITETAVINDLQSARRSLGRLKSLGIGIALDDFGTGFSSLSLVQALPLTRIKIDRSFVADVVHNNLSAAVVHSIVALSRGCDLLVTAEGVETKEQRDTLVASGCTNMQGYFYGRPVPVVDSGKKHLGSLASGATGHTRDRLAAFTWS